MSDLRDVATGEIMQKRFNADFGKVNCPKCGGEVDAVSDYLSYPTAGGEPFPHDVYCYLDDCEHEFEITLELRVMGRVVA